MEHCERQRRPNAPGRAGTIRSGQTQPIPTTYNTSNLMKTRLTCIAAFALLLCPCNYLDAQEATQESNPALAIPESDEGLPGTGPIRRYDWFQNLWQRRRSMWSQQVQADQKAVVFLGDSITQGWGPTMKGSFGEMKVANRGISGDTTRGMLIRLKADVLSLNPSAVVMLMGTNDLEEMATPEQVAQNFEAIIGEFKAHNADMPIIVCQVFPSSDQKKRPADKIKRVNELYAGIVKGDSQVTVVDTWTLFANEQGDAKIEEFPDLLHPNELGYNKWTKALRPIFETLGLLDVAVDDFEPEAGFASLFNGKDLTGWCYLPTSPAMRAQRDGIRGRIKWPLVEKRKDFDGQSQSSDGRYVAANGRLVVTTPPDGRSIQQLWTTQEFPQDFTLKLEFRATPNADSGIFLRGKQLQCRDYLLAGPYKELKDYREGDWNEIVVEVKGTVARCTCNGEVLEESFELPESGPIGLEGDRGQIEYRRIRIAVQ